MKSLCYVIVLSLLILCSPCLGQGYTGVKPPLGTLIDRSDPINTGLVAYWLMNEGAGTRVNDLSGNNVGGAITGASWVAGAFGSCMSFDGSDEVVVNPLNSRVGAAYTVTLWCSTSNTGNMALLQIASTFAIGSYGYDFTFRTGSDLYTIDEALVETSTWHHLVALVDGGVVVGVYLDGRYIADDGGSSALFIYEYNRIGSRGSTGYYTGLIDNVMVFNRVLSPPEIARLYREPFAGIAREPVEFYVSSGSAKPQVISVIMASIMAGIPVWVVLIMVGVCVWDMKQRNRVA